jgi:type I restriction-modification system DNA methylase subunit
MTSQITAPAIIHKLVETFEQNLDSYRSSKNETELRREFLDKFFTALGWDVANEKGYDEAHKEVVHEFSVEVEGQGKKADYAFRTGAGKFDFLVEAKKPSVKIESSQESAFQLRRYGWSAKLPLNILTDFEHFAIYDCRAKPNHNDKVLVGRHKIFHYKEYTTRWNEIVELFSPEAVRKGSLTIYAEKKKVKGTADVDDAFLQEIERWRELLAKNIATRNENIDIAGLNYSVQMTIDRIIFLRICEERGIEPENQLLEIANHENSYEELCELFKRADTKYNSGLFHFNQEKGQNSRPDDLTLSLDIDDKVLKDIISNLYYPKSPYAFLYIPSDILGQVYERFLGKVIRLTVGHNAKVEEKPEVRKAGGVYYTPTYIVEYIVKNTIGTLVNKEISSRKAGMTPADAAKLKIVDPACGSGTFLLGAYQFLLDWHLNWYVENEPEKWASGKSPAIYKPITYYKQAEVKEDMDGKRVIREGVAEIKGEWKLTAAKKREILLNNIYGVDIDPQAVEVTKLSLLLKVLENGNGQLGLGMERILPDLGNNIKCGNSLIGFDYFEGQLLPEETERAKVNPFNWKNEFKEVFSNGGFDAVIGNPPYVRSQTLTSEHREYFNKKYTTATKTYDIYVLFVEKAISLLSEKGRCGFILPNKFFTTDYGEGLRKLLGKNNLIERIVDFEDGQIFVGAGTYTNLLFLKKYSTNEPEYIGLGTVYRDSGSHGLENALLKTEMKFQKIKITEDGSRWILAAGIQGDILLKAKIEFPSFVDFSPHIYQGLKTSADKIYLVKVLKEHGKNVSIQNGLGEESIIEKDLLRQVVKGEDVHRYFTDKSQNLYILYPYTLENGGKANIISAAILEKKYPKAWKYLNEHKKILGARDNGIWNSRKDWYAYARSQNISAFVGEKFLIPYMTTRLRVNLDKDENLFFVNITTGGYGFRLRVKENPEYVMALLNSKFLNYSIQQMTNKFRGGYFAVNKQGIERLPYRPIDFSNLVEKSQHDKIVILVEQIQELHKRLAKAKTPQEKEGLARQIQDADSSIDSLVYELYGLNEEEIKIVENKT